MTQPFAQTFEVRHHETDLVSLIRLLNEAAGQHARAVRIDTDEMRAEGLAWVLSRFHLRVDEPVRMPQWRDKITVETWRTGLERIFALRDYRVLDPTGRPFAVATSAWLLFDLKKRRATSIPKDFHPNEGDRALVLGGEKVSELEPFGLARSFDVQHSDLDRNEHATNTSYVRWALDTVPTELWRSSRPCELEIEFRSEVVGGCELLSAARVRDAGGGRSVSEHRLVNRKTDKTAAAARLHWIPEPR